MITDPFMAEKMKRALKIANNVYTLDDIMDHIKSGKMQGHVEGSTWAITQVHEFPRKKAVDILYVVGSLESSLKLENKIEHWARELGADLLTATGRSGWWDFRTLGWKRNGVVYAKELKNG